MKKIVILMVVILLVSCGGTAENISVGEMAPDFTFETAPGKTQKLSDLKGKVVAGQGLGREKLVPTINIAVEGYRIPKEGVYATLTRLDDNKLYPSISFIGQRHITDGSFAIETHILDEEVKQSQRAEISLIHFIRENRKFDAFADLKEQIVLDIAEAKKSIDFLAL